MKKSSHERDSRKCPAANVQHPRLCRVKLQRQGRKVNAVEIKMIASDPGKESMGSEIGNASVPGEISWLRVGPKMNGGIELEFTFSTGGVAIVWLDVGFAQRLVRQMVEILPESSSTSNAVFCPGPSFE